MSWRQLETAAGDIAAAGQRLLQEESGVPAVAFLATTGADGSPRVHPFIPAIVDGGLWAFVVVSPKQRDPDRSGAYAIHSMLGADDESFFAAGVARRVDDDRVRSLVTSSMPYDDVDERHVLYEFMMSRALWTTWTTPTQPEYRQWSSPIAATP
jgi:hypothetical protein